MKRSDWQKLLIKKGFLLGLSQKSMVVMAAKSILLRANCAEEFAKTNTPPPMGGQGIDMLVPTLLELGTEEQKQKYIEPTLNGEIIWPGYSEPNAGSDLASLRLKQS